MKALGTKLFHLAGKVDRFAPVEIKGRLDPLDPLQQLDVTAYFRQVELTTLSPYTGKFAGYAVRKGRLDLDLQYRIDDGKLQAQNHVVLDQLELGERVDSMSGRKKCTACQSLPRRPASRRSIRSGRAPVRWLPRRAPRRRRAPSAGSR